jgi:hypothetical protein
MIRFLLFALAFAAGTAPAVAQRQRAPAPARAYSQTDLWTRSGDRINFTLADVSFPTEAGATRLERAAEASQEGQGLDNVLIYATPDRAVFVTVYIYAPALPDAALTAFMTDHVVGSLSGPEFRRLRSGVVAAGGHEGVAIRFDYTGARQERLASSAAFMRVGRWIVKLRVSGPLTRDAEVRSAMDALLRGVRFSGELQPAPAVPIAAADCPSRSARAARMLPANDAEDAAEAIMAAAGVDLPGRSVEAPARGWCRSTGYRLPNAAASTPILRDLAPEGNNGRRVLLALLSDSGAILEVVERRAETRVRYVLLHHQVGRTLVLGAYDSPPTDGQIRAIETGEDRDGGRARAVITLQANGDSNIGIQASPAPPTPRPTT